MLLLTKKPKIIQDPKTVEIKSSALICMYSALHVHVLVRQIDTYGGVLGLYQSIDVCILCSLYGVCMNDSRPNAKS